jgi:hypothetical protein
MSVWKRWVLPIVVAVVLATGISLLVVTLGGDGDTDDGGAAPPTSSTTTAPTTRERPRRGAWRAVLDDGRIVASTDAQSWRDVGTPAGVEVAGMAYGRPRWVAVGARDAAGVVVRSDDGRSWGTPVDLPDPLRAVAYGRGQFVAVGFDAGADPTTGGGVVYTSLDGQTWSKAATTSASENTFAHSLVSVAYGGGQWVAVALESISARNTAIVLYVSTDAKTWTRADPAGYEGTTFGYALGGQVAFRDGVWLVATTANAGRGPDGTSMLVDGALTRSTDLAAWTPVESPSLGERPLDAIGAGAPGWLVGARSAAGAGEVFSSPDGTTWTGGAGPGARVLSISYGR